MHTSYPENLFCIAAVHNRIDTTRRFLRQLLGQRDVEARILVVDDGSTDGTGAMLRSFGGLNLQVIDGPGDLWWGGAMRLGMETASKQMGADDALIMLNDDIDVADDFLMRFSNRARELGPFAVIGCQQRDDEMKKGASFGYKIDYLNCRIDELTNPGVTDQLRDVDAVCGRGMLVSRAALKKLGYVDAAKFPHYLGDVEYSARAKDLGFRVVCDPGIVVSTSFLASDRKRVGESSWRRYFSPVSSKNMLQHYRFWSSRGPKLLAKTAVLRFPIIKLRRAIKV